MRSILFVFFILLTPVVVAAHQPVVQNEVGGIIEIADPNTSFAYYGELKGDSQTFSLQSDGFFTLYVKLLAPDIDSTTTDYSAVVYQEIETGERIVRAELDAVDAVWESEFEFFGGDYYLNGPEYEVSDASPGTYYIDVSSPDNQGKYVLVTGTVENFSGVSPVALLKEIYGVKMFFEKSPLAILETPFMYVPAGLLVVVLLTIIFIRRVRNPKVVAVQ